MEAKSRPNDPFGLVGAVLDRKYRLDRVAAEGGFGVVYAGHHTGIDQPIAVKVMRRVDDVDPDDWADGVTAFLLEAKAIAQIKHAAVVGVLDAGVATIDRYPAGVPWIVFEWIAGETLEAHLQRRRGHGGMPPAGALALLRPAFEAIACAHAVGILHRDLKPSNIMLVSAPPPTLAEGAPAAASTGSAPVHLRVLDFGIAKLARDEAATTGGHTTTRSHSRAFSAVCAAPEQISGTRTGPWTDVYALALLLTEVLTDAPPYPAGDPNGRFAVVFDKQRPTPASLGVDVGAWEPILARALAVNPAERHVTVKDLLTDLDTSLALAVSAPLDSPAGGTSNALLDRTTDVEDSSRARTGSSVTGVRRGRRRGAAALGVAVVVAAASAFGWRAWEAGHPSSAGREVNAAIAERCSSNRACSEGGAHSICRTTDGRCVPLASLDCTPLADEAAFSSDDTVWIGAMFPTTGPDSDSIGSANMHAVELARRDFAQTMSAVSTTRRDDAARPLGVVACDDAADPARAASHLVADIGVPAIIGFHGGVEAMELALSLFLPNHVLSITTTSNNPLVTRVPEAPGEPRLVWRSTFNAATSAAALVSFSIGVLEPKLRAARAVGPHDRVRIALVRPGDALGAAHVDAVVRALDEEPRGKDGQSFRDFPYDSNAPDSAAPFAAIEEDLLAFRPNVVLFTGGQPVIQTFERIERRWPRAAGQRPYYASLATIGSYLLDLVGADPDRRRRVFGVTTLPQSPANTRFLNRYNEAFPDDHVTRLDAPDTTYDAFYLLAYASYTVPPASRVDGPALSVGFDRLRAPGPKLQVGLVDIFDGYRELSAGRSIDLVGASGDLDLDRATGEAAFDQSILCVAADAHGRAVDGVESGLVYSATQHRLIGKMRCP